MAGSYDVIVIGAGHAGCEAALSAAQMGMKTCLFTLNIDTVGQMSCNPAIGGLAKGHLVREIDALGGRMARVADLAGIQFKMLNMSKGPAVQALRAQEDRALYRRHMRMAVEAQNGLYIKQEMIEKIIVEDGRVVGVSDSLGISHGAGAVVVTTGTFLGGLMHIGLENRPAGRAGEFPSVGLSLCLKELGFAMGRLKTGTPPRLDARSIDFSKTSVEKGDDPPIPFSYSTEEIKNPQLPCYMTYTTETTRRIILENLHRSPLFGGKIKGVGPRYCPSIEDKAVRFPERPRHQVFLEPEGLDTAEYYANGISTSLPFDVQLALVRSIPGLKEAEIMRPGYAVEYDFVYPTELWHSLETKKIRGLFLGGQINGTSGYEEAAAQGLMAGINAALGVKGMKPLILQRHEAYIGVLIDDLVTKGTLEPYRMFTSRAEYRLLLRHDNADIRLREKGHEAGLVGEAQYALFKEKRRLFGEELKRLRETRVRPKEVNPLLEARGTAPIREDATLDSLIKRPEVKYDLISGVSPPVAGIGRELMAMVETEAKYEGYIKRQFEAARRLEGAGRRKIPPDFDYRSLGGLSSEVVSKLEEVRPLDIAQAGRIPGVTPSALFLLMVGIERKKRTDGA